MEPLMKGEIQAFLEENRSIRNGYYERDIGTRYGKIDNLRVPRDRNSQFRSALFEPYQRNIWIESCCLHVFQGNFNKEDGRDP